MATATATIPAASTAVSTARSLAATLSGGTPLLAAAAFSAADRRRSVITSMAPSTTSSARPMTGPSCRSGPFQRGVATAPRSPASPRMISSTSVTTSGQGWPAAERGPAPVPGAVRSGSLVIRSSFPDLTGDGPWPVLRAK